MSRVALIRESRAARLAAAAALVLSLAACFGGDDDDAVVSSGGTGAGAGLGSDNAVPDGAGISVASFVAFLAALSGNDESSEPATIGESFTAPADETSEPTALPS